MCKMTRVVRAIALRTNRLEPIAMAEGVESALLQLISKVEASQSLIDELELQVQQLKLQLENQEKMQEELEYYFLMSRKQSVIIKAAEQLQARFAALFTRVVR